MLIASVALAYQIFSQARAYWDAQVYPSVVDYDTVVEIHDVRGDRSERYTSVYDAASGRVWIDPVSDYELAHPARIHGIGINEGRFPRPAPDVDFIGLPMLAPNYSFTLAHSIVARTQHTDAEIVQQVRAEFHETPKPIPSPSPLDTSMQEITTVTAYRKDYDITLVGNEMVNGETCYHLALKPRIVNGDYRLRDLWIDEVTYATVRARTALNFVDGPGTQIPWLINFADVDGARYITSEAAEATYRYDRARYDRVSIRFEHIRARSGAFPIEVVAPAVFLLLTEP